MISQVGSGAGTASFLIKVVLVLATASTLRRYLPDIIGRLLAAWMVVEAAFITFLLGNYPVRRETGEE